MLRNIRLAAALSIALVALSVNPNNRVAVQLTPAYANQSAQAAWNSVCATYEFPAVNLGTSGSWTFHDAWNSIPSHALTESSALAACCSAVDTILGSGDPGLHGDEFYKATLQTNWPN